MRIGSSHCCCCCRRRVQKRDTRNYRNYQIDRLKGLRDIIFIFPLFSVQPVHTQTHTHTQFEAERVRYKLNKITIL